MGLLPPFLSVYARIVSRTTRALIEEGARNSTLLLRGRMSAERTQMLTF